VKLQSWLVTSFLAVHLSLFAYNEGVPESIASMGLRSEKEEEGGVKPVLAELRQRQPDWRPRITGLFPDGSAETVIFYELGEDGREHAVKETRYFANGQVKMDGDLLELVEGEEPLPHGVRVNYYVTGVPEQVAYYDRGRLHGPLQLFYPNGQLKRLEMMQAGERSGKWETYDEDGSKRDVACYLNGKIVGDLVSFYANGVKAASIPYGKAGLPDGVATEWFESGSVKSTKRYSDGLLCGDGWNPAVTLYYENQAIAEVQDFRDGIPLGTHFKYFESGREAYKASYKSGKRHGAEQWFFEDGQRKGHGEWREGVPIGKHWMNHSKDQLLSYAEYDNQGRLVRPVVEFYENGAKKAEYFAVDGHPEGEVRNWFDNGQLKSLYIYRDGQLTGEQCEYFESGQLQVRSHFAKGVRTGLHEEWHENGQLAVRLQLIDGEKDGECVRWHANGRQSELESYRQGILHGKSAQWWEDGSHKFEMSYENGERHGWCREWSPSGVLLVEAKYELGQPASNFRQWHENGQLAALIPVMNGLREGAEERFYANGVAQGVAHFHQDQLHGEIKTWFEDGSLQRVQHFEDGMPVGLHKEYLQAKDKDGNPQLSRVISYSKGKLDGEQKSYHKNGLAQAVVTYRDGVLNGLKALWDENGNLIEEGWYEMGNLQGRFFHREADGREVVFHYKDNRREGVHQAFYASVDGGPRVKAFEANYVNGKIEGEVSEYSETGAKLASTIYRHGKKNGRSCLYSEEGKLLMVMEFVDDVNHGPMVQYFPNGRILKSVTFVEGQKHGEEVAYYLDGQVASCYPYEMGRLNGLAREWNDQGKLVFEAEYANGIREGRFNKYYHNGQPQVLQNFRQDKLHGIKRIYNQQGQVTEVRYENGKRVYG
jgi:uncharacterized protein